METESPPSSFTYLGRTFTDLTITKTNNTITSSFSSSTLFSECNSDRSDEFSPAATHSHHRHRWLTSASTASSSSSSTSSDNLTDLYIRYLITGLNSSSINDQKQATMEIRLLAKNNPENRLKIARSGAIGPLISLLITSDSLLQEYVVTAILNLSLCDENRELIVNYGAINPLVSALRSGTMIAKENAACALLRLSQMDDDDIKSNNKKYVIGRSGAIAHLVNLLDSGGVRGKKDALTALYSICSVKENKVRGVEAGIVRVLLELMAEFGTSSNNIVDKAAYVMSLIVMVSEGRVALVEEGGIPVVVEIVETGNKRQKEVAVVILLRICEVSVLYRRLVVREDAIPPLVALLQSGNGSSRAKKKAERLIEMLRQQISDDNNTTVAGKEIIA